MTTPTPTPDRARQFIENFSGPVEMALQRAPDGLSICFAVYVRDPNNRTPEQPDGVTYMTSWSRSSYFDRQTFKEFVNTQYSKDNSDGNFNPK